LRWKAVLRAGALEAFAEGLAPAWVVLAESLSLAAFSRRAWSRAALGPSPPIFCVGALGMKSLMWGFYREKEFPVGLERGWYLSREVSSEKESAR